MRSLISGSRSWRIRWGNGTSASWRQVGRYWKGLRRGLMAHKHPEASVANLGTELGAFGVRPPHGIEPAAPLIGFVLFHDQKCDRSGGGSPPAQEPVKLCVHGVGGVASDLSADSRRDYLEYPGSDGVHDAKQCGELFFRGERSGYRVAPEVTVTSGAPGREPEGARFQSGLHDGADGEQVVCGRIFQGPISHDVRSNRSVGNVGADVYGPRDAVQGVEVLGKALPRPVDSFGQGAAGNVLDAFHQLDKGLLSSRTHRRKPDSAVPENGSRHAVPARGSQVPVPGGLAIEVGMYIDEPGGDDGAVGVDDPVGQAVHPSHFHDPSVDDGDVGCAGRPAGAIDHRARPDHEIVHAAPFTSSLPVPLTVPHLKSAVSMRRVCCA